MAQSWYSLCLLVGFICSFAAGQERRLVANQTQVRLKSGDKPSEGRVEIFYDGEWGTMCDDGWNIQGANVVCRMLGFDGAVEHVHSGKFGPGDGPILMDNVACTGTENSLAECMFNGWGEHDCSHHEDAGVKCNARRIPGYNQRTQQVGVQLELMRLRPPRGQRKYLPQSDGFVEIFHKKKWRKICVDDWDEKVALVICGQLGFPSASRIRQADKYLAKAKKRHNYVLTNVTCTGTESQLEQCEWSMLDIKKKKVCRGGQPLITRCDGGRYARGYFRKKKGKILRTKPSADLPIRLKAASAEGHGRLEVKVRGRWGTVCHREFTILSGNVACRELGYGTAKRIMIDSFFGNGHGRIWMTGVRCRGNETNLLDCNHELLTSNIDGGERQPTDCTHHEDVSVACHVPELHTSNKIRLVGGRNPMEGRVEVKVRRKWGPVCSDDWTIKDAMVVCRQLGLGFALAALKDVYFYPGTANVTELMMTGVSCKGDEIGLQYCKHDGKQLSPCGTATRTMTPFAGVICTEMSPDLVQDIALLQQSIHLDEQPLHNLYCASEEKCLSPSAADMDWPYGSRRLLRFSTRVWNRGRSDFRPAKMQDQWIWHQCHGHYHSMSEFTHYDILDLNFTKMAEGHKASFCLEDTECDPGVSKRFDCDQPGGGVQGIAVGCADNYQYNIDCQWIDITDVTSGNYLLRITVNPNSLVAESDYGNNIAFCNLQYDGQRVWAWNCHMPDDFDAETLAQYYTNSVYP